MPTKVLMKLTHFVNGEKKHTYMTTPNADYQGLNQAVRDYYKSINAEMPAQPRMYWIDDDADEIDIKNDVDVTIFFLKNESPHLYIENENVQARKSTEKASTTNADGLFPTKAVHTHVECDMCMMKPIVGFRYKCIECPNFDLCQQCEAKHVHSEHMLVRMPHDHCPTVIDSWISGRVRRAHKRASRGHPCPFVPPTPVEVPTAPGGGDSERHHSRRSHRRRDMHPSLFGNLYKMMQDLAEGGVPNESVNTPPEPSFENVANAAANAASTAANAASCAAAAACAAAATAAEKVVEDVRAATSEAAQPKETAKTQTNTTTGAAPKASPSFTQGNPTDTPNPETETNPNLNSPTLESLSQFIDPQYMRAGIQILNNFSEMFAKMLDPAETGEFSCPFDVTANNGTRKNSNTSNDSNNTASSTTNDSVPPASCEPTKPPTEEQTNEVEVNDAPTSTTATSKVPTPQVSLTAESRSSSIEDNDWQLIEPQSSTAAPNETVSTETTKTPPQSVDFIQLSKDLKAHIEEEQKRGEHKKQSTQTTLIDLTEGQPSTSTSVNSVSSNVNSSAALVSSTVQTAPSTLPTQPTVAPAVSTQAPVPQPRVVEDKRAVFYYHPDPRVNNAVHAMMAMGFSNEGAWLTQLLETVNGNIPEALDLMNAAQRNNN